MSRADFMRKLAALLTDVSPAEREEAIQYYNDYFDDAGAENEQSVIASLGSPEQLARTIRAGLSDGGNMGEFTEKGFSGYETRKNNEVLNPGQTGAGENPYRSNAYGYGQWNSDGNPYRGSNNNGSYQNTYTNGAGQGNAAERQDKRKLSGGAIALIILLCIFAAPVLLGVGGGLLGAVLGVFGGLIGCVFGLGIAAVVLIVVGIGVFVYGIGLMFGLPLGGLCMMGGGMICIALGLAFLWLVVLICGTLIPAIVRGIAKTVHSILHRGGVRA